MLTLLYYRLEKMSDSKGEEKRNLLVNNCSAIDVTDLEKDLAQQAHTEFMKENYGVTLSCLNRLQSTRSNDLKVSTNFKNSALTHFVIYYIFNIVLNSMDIIEIVFYHMIIVWLEIKERVFSL